MAYIGVSPSNGVRRKHTYTATASQTSFSGAGDEGATLSYTDSNFVDVYQNGVKLAEEDYTATSGTAIVLAQGASADDIVEIIAFDVFSVADTVSKADGGTFDGNVTMAGTLGVTGVLTANGGAVFNEASADVDFRVESDTGTHALFVDGATGFVGIGNSVASTINAVSSLGNLVVGSGSAAEGITIYSGADSYGGLAFADATSGVGTYAGYLSFNHTDNSLRYSIGNSEAMRIHSNQVLSASAGVALGVGTANTASNVLDDYEEGTFTPTWDGYTPYGTSGKYVKIGTQVTVYATLITAAASNSSLIQLNNLPFQISGNQGGGFVYHNSIPLYAFNIYTLFTSNSTICQLKTVSGGAEVGVKYLGSDPSMRGYSTMHWTIVYQTT